ncbi:MAG: carbohydrate ABC transporter permease [Lachnospiraceae bacterium]|nr:carbohydrate ABC transporter permease [Lachnospiraceae bacterium]
MTKEERLKRKEEKKKQKLDMMSSRKEKVTFGQIILGLILLLYTLYCFLPVVLVFVSAFTDEMTITNNGYSLFPKKWSLEGMKNVLYAPDKILSAYKVTLIVTVFGTLLGLLVMSMFAYSISRKDFVLRKFLSIFLIIPMLFNGGQLSGYLIFSNYYHWQNTYWVLILPMCVSTMNVIILRTYIVNSIPQELIEAARIDGAGEYRTFFGIVFPLMKPALAAVGFMMATAYWNDWSNAYIFITEDKYTPLQLLLIQIQSRIDFLANSPNIPTSAKLAMKATSHSTTMSTVIIVIAPIMVVYPFFQKYFIKGLTVGSVKG